MIALPAALGRTFLSAATELGFLSAARLFVHETAALHGPEGVSQLREAYGREFSVLDAVAARYLRDGALPALSPEGPLRALQGLTRVLVVGLEADALDALLPRLLGPTGPRVALLQHRSLGVVDWDRVAATYPAALERVAFEDFSRWAGARAGLLTFVYGTAGDRARVSLEWLRVLGPDTRPQFRALVGWDLLPGGPDVYPRWLGDADCADFSALVD